MLAAGRIVEAWIDPGFLGDTAIADLIAFPGDEAEQAQAWSEGTARQWEDSGAELEGGYSWLPWAHRWVDVNGDRVSALRPASPTGDLAPGIVDRDTMEIPQTCGMVT